MEMKCGIFQQRLEKLKSDFAYVNRLIEDFKRTGKEEEENIEWVIQNVENSASWFRERLRTTSEREAQEIMGDDLFVGTEVSKNIFGGMKPLDRFVPFSLAELMEAKMQGKILLYRPRYTHRGPPMTVEGMVNIIQFNDPNVNMEFFSEDHTFDFDYILQAMRNHSLKNTQIVRSTWSLIQLHPEAARYVEAKNTGELPDVVESFYDILASKKVAKFLRDRQEGMLWTSTKSTSHANEGFTILGAKPDASLRLQAIIRPKEDELPFYTCESREVD